MNFHLDFSPLLPYWPVFLKGAWLTLKMTTVAIFFGVIVGTLVAFAKRGKNLLLSRACSIYIEAVRNTPFLVQPNLSPTPIPDSPRQNFYTTRIDVFVPRRRARHPPALTTTAPCIVPGTLTDRNFSRRASPM